MINLSKEQIDAALAKLGKDVETYVWLEDNLQAVNVANDEEYQRKFNGYYRVRLNKDRLKKLYELLESLKKTEIDFGNVLQRLSDATGRVEASFSSKLAATVNPELPVIDSVVLENLALKLPPANDGGRMEKVKALHEKITGMYSEFLAGENGAYLVRRFSEKYPNAKITKVKMLDLVLWRTR